MVDFVSARKENSSPHALGQQWWVCVSRLVPTDPCPLISGTYWWSTVLPRSCYIWLAVCCAALNVSFETL